jgi:flagellar biosynthesis/type III secretory pathway protein FliH
MASFDSTSPKNQATWSANPLLNSKSQPAHFLRTQWDESSARSFGPWRVAEKVDPAEGLMAPPPVLSPGDEDALGDSPTADDLATDADTSEAEETAQVTETALNALRQEAHEQGRQEGLDQARAEIEAERQKERELIRHLGIELRSISQDPQRFFEPLKRLSLHIAEQLVRAELQLSGQAVHGLIQACIQQLDHAVEPVHVSVNPEDLQRLKAMGESVTGHLQLEADALLRPGSVKVQVQDTVVQDLIEHRLEPLARRLLVQPEAWMQKSSLVKDTVEAMPADTPRRDWSRSTPEVADVVDLEDIQDAPHAHAAEHAYEDIDISEPPADIPPEEHA